MEQRPVNMEQRPVDMEQNQTDMERNLLPQRDTAAAAAVAAVVLSTSVETFSNQFYIISPPYLPFLSSYIIIYRVT